MSEKMGRRSFLRGGMAYIGAAGAGSLLATIANPTRKNKTTGEIISQTVHSIEAFERAALESLGGLVKKWDPSFIGGGVHIGGKVENEFGKKIFLGKSPQAGRLAIDALQNYLRHQISSDAVRQDPALRKKFDSAYKLTFDLSQELAGAQGLFSDLSGRYLYAVLRKHAEIGIARGPIEKKILDDLSAGSDPRKMFEAATRLAKLNEDALRLRKQISPDK